MRETYIEIRTRVMKKQSLLTDNHLKIDHKKEIKRIQINFIEFLGNNFYKLNEFYILILRGDVC